MGKEVTNSRRAFLRAAGAVVGGAAGALATGQAQAFRLLPADDYPVDLQKACVADSQQLHRQILDDVQKQLGIKLDEEEAQEILRQMSCPSCGCSLQAAFAEASASGF